jgi:plasmid stabilization system protein ParE
MAKKPRQLTLRYSLLVNPRLAEVWRWNADRYGVAHADDFVNFLKEKTRALETEFSKGRVIPTRPSYHYITLKKRARGHGYVVVYQILPTEVYVFYYFHTAQDWLAQLDAMQPPE